MIEQQLNKARRITNVLVATDGSEFSASATGLAIEVAKHCGARLTVMTMVLFGEDLEMVGTHAMRASQDKEAQARLDKVSAQAVAAGVDCDTLIRYGEDPAQEIVDTADELDVDLIVMGRRGKRGLARMMVGDATAKVVGNAGCPVLIAPRGARMWNGRIVLATDGSAHSEAAAASAIAFAERAGLPLTVMSATTASHSAERRAQAQAAVDKVAGLANSNGVVGEALVAEGRPDEIVVATAQQKGADLIVVGSHGRTGIAKILLGSISERIIGAAPCPVLVAKPA